MILYLPLGSPHTPIVPSPEWIGRSGLGKYGDFVMQTDDALAAVMEALERAGVANNTLLIYLANLFDAQPGVAAKLLQQLESDISRGRSTEGPAAANDIPDIVLWKSGQP